MLPNPSWQQQVEARQKLIEPFVQRAIDRVCAAMGARRPKITGSFFYGAIGVHPKHLAVWFVFATDAAKNEAEANGLLYALDRMSRQTLREEGYDPAVLNIVGVSFASDEEIHCAGGWRAFFA